MIPNSVVTEMMERGYYLNRETFRFGTVGQFRHRDTGELLFYVPLYGLMTGLELYNHLLDCWVPQSEDDIIYKLHYMEGDFLGVI